MNRALTCAAPVGARFFAPAVIAPLRQVGRLLLLLLVVACTAPPPVATPTPSPEAATATAEPPTQTAPTLTDTPTPAPTTVVPTATATPSPSPSPSPTTVPTPEPEQVLVSGSGSPFVNMRREPGTTAPVVKSVADGTLVTVIGSDREAEGRIWRNVQDGDTTGWIVGSALRPVLTPTTTPSTTPTPGPTATASETPGVTPASAPPTTTAPPATSAPPATGAPPEPTSAPAHEEPTPERERVEVYGTDPQGANLRAQPGRRGAVIRSVPDGSHLTVIGEDQEADGATWRNVQADDGTTGWLSTEVIRTIVAPTPTPRPGAPGIGAPIPVEDQPESELTEEQRAATPCRPGQLKGDAATGIYYPPDDPAYPELRQRVRCFDDASRARASGFRPPEASPEPSPAP